jgi:hypothetical protein
MSLGLDGAPTADDDETDEETEQLAHDVTSVEASSTAVPEDAREAGGLRTFRDNPTGTAIASRGWRA